MMSIMGSNDFTFNPWASGLRNLDVIYLLSRNIFNAAMIFPISGPRLIYLYVIIDIIK